MLLGDYLDVRNTAATQSPSTMSFEEATTDIGAYFLKKRPAKTKKVVFCLKKVTLCIDLCKQLIIILMEDIYIALYHVNSMLNALITLLSQQASIILHNFILFLTFSLAADYTCSGYYHAQYKLS